MNGAGEKYIQIIGYVPGNTMYEGNIENGARWGCGGAAQDTCARCACGVTWASRVVAQDSECGDMKKGGGVHVE